MPEKSPERLPNVFLITMAVIFLVLFLKIFVLDLAFVQGRSMEPALGQGDIVVILKIAYGLRNPSGGYLLQWSRPRNRHIVAAFRPGEGSIVIKRVWSERDDGDLSRPLVLLGDNIYDSVDSREFGLVPMNNILGKVLRFSFF